MSGNQLRATVRKVSPLVKVIDIEGEISSFTEKALVDAYDQAGEGNFRTIIFNFRGLEFLNSKGIGMLVMLLVRARREGKNVAAYGLSDHYRHIFEITRIDQVLPVFSTEEIAIRSAEPMDLPEREN